MGNYIDGYWMNWDRVVYTWMGEVRIRGAWLRDCILRAAALREGDKTLKFLVGHCISF